MKCKKCDSTMVKKEVKPGSYVYVCPNCGHEVGK